MPTLKRYRHAHTLTLGSYPGYREPINVPKRHAIGCTIALVALAVLIALL